MNDPGRRCNETEYQAALFVQTLDQSSKYANTCTSLRIEGRGDKALESLEPVGMRTTRRETLLKTAA
jgi:hypothetical protein